MVWHLIICVGTWGFCHPPQVMPNEATCRFYERHYKDMTVGSGARCVRSLPLQGRN